MSSPLTWAGTRTRAAPEECPGRCGWTGFRIGASDERSSYGDTIGLHGRRVERTAEGSHRRGNARLGLGPGLHGHVRRGERAGQGAPQAPATGRERADPRARLGARERLRPDRVTEGG